MESGSNSYPATESPQNVVAKFLLGSEHFKNFCDEGSKESIECDGALVVTWLAKLLRDEALSGLDVDLREMSSTSATP